MQTNLPAFLQDYKNRGLAKQATENLGSSAPPYMSIESNRFTLVDSSGASQQIGSMDPKLGLYVDVVITHVNAKKSKIFYSDYDPSNPQPPICWSDNGIGPSRNAAQPQAPTCAACPNSVWGSKISKISQKGIPACSDYQKIILFVVGQDMPYLLRIPPNSLRHFASYTERFNGQQFDLDVVVTRISFASGVQGTLTFTPMQIIDQDIDAIRRRMLAFKQAETWVGAHDQPRTDLPAPAAKQEELPFNVAVPDYRLYPEQQNELSDSITRIREAHTPAQAVQSTPSPVPGAFPTAASEPATRRRRRTKAEMEAARAGVPAAPAAQAGQVPPAPPAPPTVSQPPTAPFPHAQPAAPFGVASSAPAPDAGMLDALAKQFGP